MDIFKRSVFRGCLLLAILILALASLVWAATPHCPSGYTLTADGRKCVKDLPASCQTGYTFSGGYCQKEERTPSCYFPGETFDSRFKVCITSSSPTITCGGTCTYDATLKKCVSEATFHCLGAYNYYPADNKCKMVRIPNCSNGFQLNTTRDACLKVTSVSPDCPSGSNYNGDRKVCEEFATPYCDAGYALKNGQCVQPLATYQ